MSELYKGDRGQTAHGIMTALHKGDANAAARILSDLSTMEMVAVVIDLADGLLYEWQEHCRIEGLDMDLFMQEAGLTIACRAEVFE